MIEFRNRMAAEAGMELIVHTNEEGRAANINPFDHGSAKYTDIMKTQALKQALDKYGFDAAARAETKRHRVRKSVFTRSVINIIAGTLRTSALSCGMCITPRLIKANQSVCFRSPIGPS
ncbi:hypothetical protein HSBAA_22760 [Vreelandella sulfidaeris]|uniref:Phosphoadenosine phosphosulphate reductase domain-containing protein n=1 Tax=Vreelandella sulfidaeris TaxID=115553 RepID=A0A455U4E1_9GAMM|nr:hypothetical protein HSBAA_22760 [Halomonas sulfidaeris]